MNEKRDRYLAKKLFNGKVIDLSTWSGIMQMYRLFKSENFETLDKIILWVDSKKKNKKRDEMKYPDQFSDVVHAWFIMTDENPDYHPKMGK